MKPTTISLLVAGLFLAAPDSLAQLKVSGSVSGTLLGTSVKSQNRFKFEEYRDLGSGLRLGGEIKGESNTYHLNLFGENLGRDDQFVDLKGGKYGAFKYSLTNNNIIHNLTFGAITPFAGGGTNNLTFSGAAPSTNTATWNRFEYSVKHENLGGTFEWSARSPFYLRATANQKETKGIKPIGGPGTSPGGPTYELPAVVDYTTTDASAEAGYATKTAQYSLNLSWSRFRDNNDFLVWRNPAITNAASATTTETTTLAADNNLWKAAANAMWKQLPVGSTLALRGTYSKLTNGIPVATTYTSVVAGTGNLRLSNPSNTMFNGEVINKSFSASLTSQPARALDSRLYWNWNKKDNNSTSIVFRPSGPGSGGTCDLNPVTGAALTTCTTELFHYRKNNLGLDLQYRVNPQNKLSGGWDYTDTTRERIDYDRTKENKVYVEWKNSSLEMLSAKLKYQHLARRSDFLLGDLNPALSATNFFEVYLKRYDLSDNDQDMVKLVLDSSPAAFLDLGGELIWKRNDYRNVQLGRNKDDRKELYLTASYGDAKRFRITGFFDVEATQYDSTHWQGAPNAATFPAAVSATRFLWKGKVRDKNHVIGLGGDWPYSARLRFKGSLIWQDTDGSVGFSANHPLAGLVNIPAFDSFRRNVLDLRAAYAVEKAVDVDVGYAYESYKPSDVQMDGYNYTQRTGTNQNFLSGAYAFSKYKAHLLHATLKYKFQ